MTTETKTYRHPEAYCLMQYQDQVTGEIEVIWNSRDGVTPFVVESPKGNEAHHIDWRADKRRVDFVPPPGMRMFVDASPNHRHISRSAREYVDKYWDLDIGGGMTMRNTLLKPSGAEMTKGEAVYHFITEWTKPGSPTIVKAGEVDDGGVVK
jgi:hypothetical protein